MFVKYIQQYNQKQDKAPLYVQAYSTTLHDEILLMSFPLCVTPWALILPNAK